MSAVMGCLESLAYGTLHFLHIMRSHQLNAADSKRHKRYIELFLLHLLRSQCSSNRTLELKK